MYSLTYRQSDNSSLITQTHLNNDKTDTHPETVVHYSKFKANESFKARLIGWLEALSSSA